MADTQRRSFECAICQKKYTSRSNLNHHTQVKHAGRIFVCPYCDEVHNTKDLHVKHLRRAHRGQPIGNVSANIRYRPNAQCNLTSDQTKDDIIAQMHLYSNEQKRIIDELMQLLNQFRAASPVASTSNAIHSEVFFPMSSIRRLSFSAASQALPAAPVAPAAPATPAMNESDNSRWMLREEGEKVSDQNPKAEADVKEEPTHARKTTVVIKFGTGENKRSITVTG